MIASFLKILGANDQEIALGCIAWLESHGYVVAVRGKWEREIALCKRLKISTSKFRRRLKRWARSRPLDAQFGPKGKRLVLIRSNPELDSYLSALAGSKPIAVAIAGVQPMGKRLVQKGAKIRQVEEVSVVRGGRADRPSHKLAARRFTKVA